MRRVEYNSRHNRNEHGGDDDDDYHHDSSDSKRNAAGGMSGRGNVFSRTFFPSSRDDEKRREYASRYRINLENFKNYKTVPTAFLIIVPKASSRDHPSENLPSCDNLRRALVDFGDIYLIKYLKNENICFVKTHTMPAACALYHAINTTSQTFTKMNITASFTKVSFSYPPRAKASIRHLSDWNEMN